MPKPRWEPSRSQEPDPDIQPPEKRAVSRVASVEKKTTIIINKINKTSTWFLKGVSGCLWGRVKWTSECGRNGMPGVSGWTTFCQPQWFSCFFFFFFFFFTLYGYECYVYPIWPSLFADLMYCGKWNEMDCLKWQRVCTSFIYYIFIKGLFFKGNTVNNVLVAMLNLLFFEKENALFHRMAKNKWSINDWMSPFDLFCLQIKMYDILFAEKQTNVDLFHHILLACEKKQYLWNQRDRKCKM